MSIRNEGEEELDFDQLDEESGDDDDADLPDVSGIENKFGVEEDGGRVIFRTRPGARMSTEDALNLAAHIVAATETEIDDFEAMVREASE